METQYLEDVRELTPDTLSNYGINPIALDMMIKDYETKVRPFPCKILFDTLMEGIWLPKDHVEEIEIYLSTPGYLGKRAGDPREIRKFAIRLVAKSYYDYIRPKTISFLFNNVEVTLKTRGYVESKNIARDIYDPTK